MARHPIECASGNTYVCHVPDLSVIDARARLEQVSAHNDVQLRLENRARLIERHYNNIAEKKEIVDLDKSLAELDEAADKARASLTELKAFADSKVMLEFFCDQVEGLDAFTNLPVGDASELYRKCRSLVMGVNPDPPAPTE